MSNKFILGYKDINTYDELPLWSAPFGMKLLETITYAKGLSVLDIGAGTGFPSLEIAQRLGGTSFVYGLDTWSEGIKKAEQKAKAYQVKNVEYIRGTFYRRVF